MGFERDIEMADWGTEFLRRGINAMDIQKNSVGEEQEISQTPHYRQVFKRGGSGGRGVLTLSMLGSLQDTLHGS